MTLTPEDGTGVADANCYIDQAYADTYFTDRGDTVWSAAAVADKEAAIIKATDYIELRFADRWKGALSADATTLSWPRDYVYDRKGAAVTNAIPEDLKKASAEYALRALSAALLPDPTVEDNGQLVKSTLSIVGPITDQVTYQTGGQVNEIRSYPAADRLLKFWLISSGGVYR
jgi:hypothetical protein